MGKKVSVRGSLLGEIEKRKVVRDKKEVIETRFILFKSRGSEYIRCVFYGNESLNYRNGDLVYVFGSYLSKEEKFYKSFKVNSILRW
ncbi:MAG TPA: hypothetical protein H9923_01500 [Candidatus Dwaynia gallinarum]|nr:hypothetical protein [Candidatus Dwaynia gallinarum]